MAERVPLHPRTLFRSMLRSVSLCSLALPAMLGGTAHGQHSQETARQRIRLRAYGLFSYVDPDFQGDKRNLGATFGGDIDALRLLPHTDLGLDVRYSFSSGNVLNQRFFGGGPRLSLDVGRFKPYVDFILGEGEGTFNMSTEPTYTHDKTGSPTYGGGFDYQLTRSWAIRADIQRERWRFTVKQPYFYPVAASVGASYQFHFHSRTGPGL